ncbi:MAG: sensor domain-containing diguanylate cyclase, partial [Proteobacteria bacterium]
TFLSSVLEHLIVGMRFDVGCLFIRPIPKLGPHAVFAKLNKAKPKEGEAEKPYDLAEEDTQWISEMPKSALQYLKTQSAVLETIPHAQEERARLQVEANGEEQDVAVAALRITQGARTIGTIHLINKDPNFKLNVYEANFLKNLASQVSVILENRALQYTSQVDSLTQLYNRSFLVSKLQEELVRSSRTSLPLSFLILDVDHFKKINDRFGHQGGDEALITLSSLLKTTARNTDFICRYGGEEIAIILPDTPLAGAEIFANNVRAAIESHPFLLNGLEPTQVTVSIGVTSHTPADPLILEAMIGRADTALYEAKRTGRNRVCIFGQTTGPAADLS